ALPIFPASKHVETLYVYISYPRYEFMRKRFYFTQKLAALMMIYAMVAPALISRAEVPAALKPLTEEQKILHVLNRLGFGARPGDVAKVKVIGLQKYIDQQLDGASINDSVAEAKVKNLDIFNMSTAELFAKYPNPGALLRQLDGQGKKAANTQTAAKPGAPANGAAPPAAQADPNALTPDEQRERRAKIQAN